MLTVMRDIPLESLVRAAQLAGFDWNEQDLESIRPGLTLVLAALARLERLPIGAAEPTTTYRVV